MRGGGLSWQHQGLAWGGHRTGPLKLDSPSHSSLSGLKLMAKSWETWRARREGGAGATPHHDPQRLPSPTGAMAKGAQRDEHVPGVPQSPRYPNHPLTSYLGGILAPKPRAENFLSLQEKGVRSPGRASMHGVVTGVAITEHPGPRVAITGVSWPWGPTGPTDLS